MATLTELISYRACVHCKYCFIAFGGGVYANSQWRCISDLNKLAGTIDPVTAVERLAEENIRTVRERHCLGSYWRPNSLIRSMIEGRETTTISKKGLSNVKLEDIV